MASTTTPTKPVTRAIARRMPIFSPNTTNATSAANSTVIALQIAPIAAGARCAAQANSRNGSAELMIPIAASRGHRRKGNWARASHRNGRSTSAPKASRSSTSAYGPNAGAATRMNRNEPPQTAPSASSSNGVRQSRAVVAAAGV